MSTEPMGVFEFIACLVSILAWPAAIVICALIIRAELNKR